MMSRKERRMRGCEERRRLTSERQITLVKGAYLEKKYGGINEYIFFPMRKGKP